MGSLEVCGHSRQGRMAVYFLQSHYHCHCCGYGGSREVDLTRGRAKNLKLYAKE